MFAGSEKPKGGRTCYIRYRFTGTMMGEVEVEAEDISEAKRKAEEAPLQEGDYEGDSWVVEIDQAKYYNELTDKDIDILNDMGRHRRRNSGGERNG